MLLLIAGVLNIVYGIAAIGDSKFFTENVTYIVSGLNTWGWILLISTAHRADWWLGTRQA